ncbi:glycosyltransferase [Natranaerobius thermophilus]|uniref:Glycosyl transferase group 1 n=1 Tax=Natranaerobius thermophilus (strain ATCC BAA-1301 / DSM 18059 / JW/NM-WN-LF) TaxID=457570 RepID=B2A0R5_NATTJ|nr:glycosyltransferase [Natranaerobius thermophilus]ACB85945.1 conserved hypothetical protein [Natranaerobius thermophilus JW/NM-WN-LF]
MIKNKDIIYFSAVDWDYVFARPQQTVMRLAQNNRVIYVEPPYSLLAPLKKPRAIKKWFSGLRKHPEKDNLYLYAPKPTLPFQGKIKGINPINQKSMGRKLKKVTKKLNFSDPMIFTTLPNTVDLLKYFPDSQVIYDCVDCHASFSGHNDELMRELEINLLERADLVFTTAYALYEDKKGFNSNCHLVPNGAQVEHFAINNKESQDKEEQNKIRSRSNKGPKKNTSEIKGLGTGVSSSGPDKKTLTDLGVSPEVAEELALDQVKIGFIGGIGDWVDLSLVDYMAQARPRWKFFMIGPLGVDPGPLAHRENVYFPGFMNYKILPQILQAFSIAICPFKKNRLTERVNPVKVYEYLAGGKPVVATDLRELQEFKEYLYLANNGEEFLSQIEKALTMEEKYHQEGMLPGIRRMRREFAEEHSWEKRVQRMEELWEKTL